MIAAVLSHYGADLSRVSEYGWRDMRCPWPENHAHGDRNKSARVNLEKDAFICLACGMKGDAISIVKQREGLDYADALEFIEGITGQAISGVRRPARDNSRGDRPSRFRTKLFE